MLKNNTLLIVGAISIFIIAMFAIFTVEIGNTGAAKETTLMRPPAYFNK